MGAIEPMETSIVGGGEGGMKEGKGGEGGTLAVAVPCNHAGTGSTTGMDWLAITAGKGTGRPPGTGSSLKGGKWETGRQDR